jgi:hypothetical protein
VHAEMQANPCNLPDIVLERAPALSTQDGLLFDSLIDGRKTVNRLDSSLNDCKFAFSFHGTEC